MYKIQYKIQIIFVYILYIIVVTSNAPNYWHGVRSKQKEGLF